jgi:hypothetical protein
MVMAKNQYSFRPFLIPLVIYITGVIIFAITVSYIDRARIIRDIDTRLINAASNIKFILPATFHDSAVDAK